MPRVMESVDLMDVCLAMENADPSDVATETEIVGLMVVPMEMDFVGPSDVLREITYAITLAVEVKTKIAIKWSRHQFCAKLKQNEETHLIVSII